MKNNVVALIVSYNGGEDLKNTVVALVAQVQKILILDNNSNVETKKIIFELISKFGVSFIEFDSNMGIGFALNKGLEIAKKENFDWILTMDQDSVASSNMISEMLASSAKFSGMKIICPLLLLSGLEFSPKDDHLVIYAITSGNLVPIEVFSKIGGFNEDYFIDSVDFEFSLRARNNGIGIVQCGRASLIHRLGELDCVKIFSINYCYTRHSPLRRYYIVRNHFYLISEFWHKNPIFLAKKSIALMRQVIEILLFDDKRVENFKMMSLGFCDFVRGRGGRFQNV